MNKIFDLYRYLKISGFGRELEILKTALETTPEELQAAFPQLFRFYEEDKPTAMFGGVFAQINKYIEQGYITQQEIDAIQTFDSLKQKMKELKTIKKETEAKFKYLNEYDIEQEFKDLAKEKKLSKEDFEFAYKSFVAEDEDNHQLDQAISEIADLRKKYGLLKEKINTIEDNEGLLSRLADPLSYKTLDNANTEINNLMMDVNNIIEGRRAGGLKKKLLNYYDYIYNGENKLNASYPKERKGKAKETSKVLYNDGDWAIVNSWSEEACQYWERSAVRVEGDRVGFYTCTSRVGGVHGLTYGNLYSKYSRYKIVQILKLENGQPKFYEGPNEMLTLCFDYANNKFKMIENSSTSVNANNKSMTKQMVAEALPENIYNELQNILNSDKKYELFNFKELLELNIPDEIRSRLMLSSVKKSKPYDFFSYKNRIPEDIFNFLVEEKAKDLARLEGISNFFAFRKDIPEDIFNSLAKEKGKELDPEVFFDQTYDIPEDIFNSLAEEKAKEADPKTFFHYKDKIPKDIFNSLEEKKAKEASPETFFDYKNKIPKDIFNSLLAENAKELDLGDFFFFKKRIPKDIFNSLIVEKAKELGLDDFFYFKKTLKKRIPKDIFNSLIIEKAKEAAPETFFRYIKKVKKIIPEDVLTPIIGTKLKELYLHYLNFYLYSEQLEGVTAEWRVLGDDLLLLVKYGDDVSTVYTISDLPQSILRGDLQRYSRYKNLSNLFIKYSK